MALFMLVVIMLVMYGVGFMIGRWCGRSDAARDAADREWAIVDRAVADVAMRGCPACGRPVGTCVHTDPAYGWPCS